MKRRINSTCLRLATSVTLTLLAVFSLLGQTPTTFNYQAVFRNIDGSPKSNVNVSIELDIHQSTETGTVVYSETHNTTTNEFGIVNLKIGSIDPGSFAAIDWTAGPYYLEVQVDAISMGVSEFLAVPYARYAETADVAVNDEVDDADPDPANELNTTVILNGTSLEVTDAGGTIVEDLSSLVDDADPDPANELNTTVVLNGTSLEVTDAGGTIVEDLSSLVDDADPDPTNELQLMSIVDGTIFLSDGGGSVVLPVIGPPGAAANDLMTFDGTNWIARDALIQNRGGGQSHNNMQPYLGINHVIALVGVYPSRSAVEPFIAEIMMFAGNFAPRGWALCDGQLLSVSSNAALFSLLGTTYGGDGRTTFALPDLRGRTAIHPGSGPGLSTRRLGERGGSETTTLSISQMPAHNHTITYQ
jgi:microcystin-dependent protein